jgi:hypothetical protein
MTKIERAPDRLALQSGSTTIVPIRKLAMLSFSESFFSSGQGSL